MGDHPCGGPIVPGYEAYCVLLNLLQLVDDLLEVYDGSPLQDLAKECKVGIPFAGCGAATEVLIRNSRMQCAFSVCHGVYVVGPFLKDVCKVDSRWQGLADQYFLEDGIV